MKLYHGSTETIKHPKLLNKQRLLDFGPGFYLTSSREQAEKWASIKKKRAGGETKAIVIYQTPTLFETGILTKPETIARLKVHRLFDQISFHTAKALAHLAFINDYEIDQVD